ncbi:conserved hypothetical protein [Tenacibaculum sediminilitoris]|uniref:hypothetical protein n=1 Tax=Tenacibaculum sediminilitoris TaxID=1820334 RepID=UPI0038947450
MEALNHIENTTLPVEVNFEKLKELGLAYIQKNNDNTWTNLNPSDPGVTILDQLCFAFTELGYCNDFSIKDILTNKEGELVVKNQFYLPENILTTSPITINDFRKYVVDKVKELINLQITPVKSQCNVYSVKVLINRRIDKEKLIETVTINNEEKEITVKSQEEIILENTFFVLNSCRNLGELFLYPTAFKAKKHQVYGQLEIESGYDINTILIEIEIAINNYVFPKLIQEGYNELKKEKETTNTIFNGPKLKNGWIVESNMRPKRNRIKAYELTEVIQSIAGVLSITNVLFSHVKTPYEVWSSEEEILVFSFIDSLEKNSNSLQVFTKGKDISASINASIVKELSRLDDANSQISKVSTVQMAPELPSGMYRDISSYYSIQNTFPDAYAVGNEGVSANASAFQVAQSRQLKGYLTLFDQVLTNQFMQLASLDKLFSFENSVTGTPSDQEQFYSIQNAFEKKHGEYPSPFVCFSPTYYYQSLYKEVPHVRPLLRNFKKHEFGYEVQTLRENGWKEYQKDPYNSYMWGLMSFMENEEVNLKRRNDILNHLLARHGESPILIDTIIEGTVYSGNSQKDKVIIKSLYLQNLGLLSYYKTKAYNFIGATKLTINHIESSSELPEKEYKELQKKLVQGNQKNFIFDTLKVDKEQKITNLDFTDFSAVELKLNLLFALNVYYQDYLVSYNNAYAYWLITQRKGFLCIETNLLKESVDYEIVITEDLKGELYWKLTQKLRYKQLIELEILLREQVDFIDLQKRYPLVKVENKNNRGSDFVSVENSSYKWSVKIPLDENSLSITDSFFENELLLIFPKFFEGTLNFKISDFKNRLSYFLESELPVQITTKNFFVKNCLLKELIIAYVNWYNSLRFNQEKGTLHGGNLIANAKKLIKILVELNQLNHD